jgi:ABC-type sugar transport system permease subunit
MVTSQKKTTYSVGESTGSMASRMSRFEKQSLVIPAAVLLLLMTIFPLLYSLAVSFNVYDLRQEVLWNFVGLAHYGKILTGDARFWGALATTLRIGITAVAIEFVLGFGIALLLYYPIRGRRVFTTLLILPVMISPVVTALHHSVDLAGDDLSGRDSSYLPHDVPREVRRRQWNA